METLAAADESKGQRPLRINVTTSSSPQPLSPGASPTMSNHTTPRVMFTTPPPFSSPQSGSPLLLTSRVKPIYPQLSGSSGPASPATIPPVSDHNHPIHEFSPARSPLKGPAKARTDTDGNNNPALSTENRASRCSHQASRSKDMSPAREKMSLTAKSSLQKIVSMVLRPPYHSGKIDKDQYTDINCNVL